MPKSYTKPHVSKRTSVESVLVASVESHLRRYLRGENLSCALGVMRSGIINADATVHVERAEQRSEWGWMFVSSMEMMLCDIKQYGRYRDPKCNMTRVCAVFELIGVRV